MESIFHMRNCPTSDSPPPLGSRELRGFWRRAPERKSKPMVRGGGRGEGTG